MSEKIKTKEISSLAKSVLSLDEHFQELDRLSSQIGACDMMSEFDLERSRKQMNRFTECGQLVSVEITNLAGLLNESRLQAEASAQVVSDKALAMQARKNDLQEKLDAFNRLGETVRALTSSMGELKRPTDTVLADEDRARLSMRLAEYEIQLRSLIEETERVKKVACESKMNFLEKQADALNQTLVAASQKLGSLTQPNQLQ